MAAPLRSRFGLGTSGSGGDGLVAGNRRRGPCLPGETGSGWDWRRAVGRCLDGSTSRELFHETDPPIAVHDEGRKGGGAFDREGEKESLSVA